MNEETRYNWIDESVVIDFPLPLQIEELVKQIEEYDREDDLVSYVCATDFLDAFAKGWIGDGLSQKQYDLLVYKYR